MRLQDSAVRLTIATARLSVAAVRRSIAFASVALLTCLAPPASAQSASADDPQVITEVLSCLSVTDTQARLACFDTNAAKLAEARRTGQIVTIDRQRATTLAHESFGFSLPNLARLLPSFHANNGTSSGDDALDNAMNEIQARVTNIAMRGYLHVYTLDNDQSWVEVQARSQENISVGDTVTIRRAALGSFVLASPHGGAVHRVHRQN